MITNSGKILLIPLKMKSVMRLWFNTNNNVTLILLKVLQTNFNEHISRLEAYLQNDECVFHAEVIRGQSFTLPDELLTLCAEEAAQVKGRHPQGLHPVVQTLVPHILGSGGHVCDEGGCQQGPQWQLLQLLWQLSHLQLPLTTLLLFWKSNFTYAAIHYTIYITKQDFVWHFLIWVFEMKISSSSAKNCD